MSCKQRCINCQYFREYITKHYGKVWTCDKAEVFFGTTLDKCKVISDESFRTPTRFNKCNKFELKEEAK